jgi:hypothetical protein
MALLTSTNQQGDHDSFITYSTILDIHLSNSLSFPSVDQNTVLATLEKLLDEADSV